MSYSIKKAGVPFIPKINVDPDLTGKAANFSVLYIDDATKVETTVAGSFVESTTVPGLYFAPAITIAVVGNYTVNIANSVDGLGNVSSPVVVSAASIDDVNDAITALKTVADTIALDVDGLNGDTLLALKDDIAAISALIDDGDTSGTATTVLDFVSQINDALNNGGTGLSALEGFTDDIENMLLGTEFLNDGTTANPFYDVANPGVAKESSLAAALTTLQGDLTTQTTTITDAITAQSDPLVTGTLAFQIAALQTVVDSNSSDLQNAGYGLSALSTQIGNISFSSDNSDVITQLGDAVYGLSALQTLIASIDGKVDTIDGKIDSLAVASSKRAYAFI